MNCSLRVLRVRRSAASPDGARLKIEMEMDQEETLRFVARVLKVMR
jgi:hypothetical protein